MPISGLFLIKNISHPVLISTSRLDCMYEVSIKKPLLILYGLTPFWAHPLYYTYIDKNNVFLFFWYTSQSYCWTSGAKILHAAQLTTEPCSLAVSFWQTWGKWRGVTWWALQALSLRKRCQYFWIFPLPTGRWTPPWGAQCALHMHNIFWILTGKL